VLVVNARLRGLLEERAGAEIEFLPVNIVDHSGEKVDASYFVVNFLRIIDCIDKATTTWEPDSLDPETLAEVENLTIDETRIDPAAQLFRPKGLDKVMLARRDLAEHLAKSNVKGLGVKEISDYDD
jgi:hypothetical protein